jgi:hypothetical protein
MVDKFLLGAMNNNSARKASASASSIEKSPKRSSDFWAIDKCPTEYEHGKPFLHDLWELLEGWWEMRKFHAWIMRATKLDVWSITTKTPRKCFGMLASPILIEFANLHALYRQKRLEYNSFPCGACKYFTICSSNPFILQPK